MSAYTADIQRRHCPAGVKPLNRIDPVVGAMLIALYSPPLVGRKLSNDQMGVHRWPPPHHTLYTGSVQQITTPTTAGLDDESIQALFGTPRRQNVYLNRAGVYTIIPRWCTRHQQHE